MDEFKKSNVNEYTAEDLNCKCVVFNPKNKRNSKKKLNRLARRRLRALDLNAIKDNKNLNL